MTDLDKVAEAIYARMNDRLKLDSGYLPKSLDKYREYASVLAQAAIDAMGWRKIESAPKDGTYVLIWLRAPFSRVEKARWCKFWENWQIDDEEFSETAEHHGIGSEVPTHFMPLPPAPKDEA